MEVKINSTNVLTAFRNADDNGKQLLKNLVGDQVDFNTKITDRVKTFEDACIVLGINPSDTLLGITLKANDLLSKDLAAAVACLQLGIIARALNEGWHPDWTNSSQYKYYPWFKHKSGLGLSCNHCDCDNSITGVGSRLCFKSSELAIYAGQQFEALYRDMFTI